MRASFRDSRRALCDAMRLIAETLGCDGSQESETLVGAVTLVSHRAVRIVLEAVESRGIVITTLPNAVARSRDDGEYLDWNTFAELLATIGAAVGGTRGLEELGEALTRAPSYRFIRTAASYTLSVRNLHELGRRWITPALFPGLHIELEDVDAETIRLCTRIPSSLRGSPEFFHICSGMVSSLPTLLDLPPSRVDATITSHVAVATVTLPIARRGSRSLLRSVRAAIGKVFFEDVVRQHAEVRTGYQALVRTRQDFREVLERAPIAVAIHREGRYVWVNPALAALLGWPRPADVVGRDILDDVHPDEVELVRARIARAPTETALGEYRLKRRDGVILNVEVAPTQLIEFDGRPARLLIANDVTERVHARAQLALADRMSSLGMLAAGVAHEINNPLTYTRLALEALAMDLSRTAAPSSARETLTMATEGVDRVRAIVGDLRTFSRADEDSLTSVDLAEVVSTTLRFARNTVTTPGSIDVELAEVPSVRGNRARIGQVVLNLLVNAYHALEERGGEGRIRIRTFRELTHPEEGGVVLEVADNGSGIAPDVLPRVFDPFFTTKAIGQGTGLGLAMCHRIVTSFGGRISVECPPVTSGLRTFFRVVLPPVAGAPTAVEATRPSAGGRRRRVLVIDDEPHVGRALKRALEDHHDVEVIHNGPDAIARLGFPPEPDLVLCDVMMPGLDGIEVFSRVRASAPALAERFVFMSGGAFTARARSFLATCANPRIDKPFDVSEIRALAERGD